MLSRVQQGRAAERNDRRFLHPRGGLAKQIYLPSLMKRPNLRLKIEINNVFNLRISRLFGCINLCALIYFFAHKIGRAHV